MKLHFILLVGFIVAVTAVPPFENLLYGNIVKNHANDNIIFSPVGVQSVLGAVYLGANGNTANELQNALGYSGSSKEQVAENFTPLLTYTNAPTPQLSPNRYNPTDYPAQLKIANQIYLSNGYTIAPKFKQLITKYFNAGIENVNFNQPDATAARINQFVAEKTANKIQNIIDPNSLSADTAAILMNAIYFKASWVNIFDRYGTTKRNFHLNRQRSIQVDTMSQTDHFNYAVLTDLDASAIELKYLNTDISLLIILPKQIDGLGALEQKLSNINLQTIIDRLKYKNIDLKLPKFKIEFEISLQSPLEQSGVRTIFTNAADLSGILKNPKPLKIDEVKQKAFIEVNESGTEAAAATFAKAVPMSLGPPAHPFIVDHPFFYAIRDNNFVYFIGHVVSI